MSDEQTFTLSNFRREDEIEDWPLGSGRRGTAIFTHETHKTRGQRINRRTPNKHGQLSKPNRSTYYERVCLADGSDGKTHYIGICQSHLCVMSCGMKFQDFAIFPKDDNFHDYTVAILDATD